MNSSTTTQRPEWLRPEQAAKLIGVSRALIYDWMNRGWIKNSNIRPRGCLRGTRLVSVDSLLAFVEGHASLPASTESSRTELSSDEDDFVGLPPLGPIQKTGGPQR